MNISEKIDTICYCEQCGRCSSSCPVTGYGNFNIRKIIKATDSNNTKKIVNSSILWECLSCGRCEDSCPNDVRILEIVRLLRKYISKNFFSKNIAPCIDACPAKINIPYFIRMILDNKEIYGLKTIHNSVPIPGILGRICGKSCEFNCKRSKIDSPVSICNLKRYVFDYTKTSFNVFFSLKNSKKKKILIIGSGPAGLSACFFLKKKGYSVSIFEKRSKAGGMLRYGIPNYRLPKSVLDLEINRIINMGVDIRTNVDIFNSNNLNYQLKKFDSIFISIGLSFSKKIFIEKCNKNNKMLISGLDFLNKISSKKIFKIGKNIMVVGGGSVAVDVAMSALRFGAKYVTIISLENKDTIPADPLELKIALKEGIKLKTECGIKKFIFNKHNVKVQLVNCLSVYDCNYIFNPKFGNKITSVIVDQIISAVGQTFDKKFIESLSKFANINIKTKKNLIAVDINNKISKYSNLFAGGDIVSGPRSVIDAVVSGRKAALSIDHFFGGNGKPFHNEELKYKEIFIENPNCFPNSSYINRQNEIIITTKNRKKSFIEINSGLGYNKIKVEASRCLRCDLEKKISI